MEQRTALLMKKYACPKPAIGLLSFTKEFERGWDGDRVNAHNKLELTSP